MQAVGFIPTQWYPTVVAATSKDLLISQRWAAGPGPIQNPAAKPRTGARAIRMWQL